MSKLQIIIISTSAILMCLIAYVYLSGKPKDPVYPHIVDVNIDEVVSKTNEYANTFTHPRYGLSISYNDELMIDRIKEGRASETIIFEQNNDAGVAKTFQIFITPHIGDVITPERFKKDIPNGDVREPQEVIVGDELRAVAFKSSVPKIGETREVWFVYDGFIYEFTTPIDFDVELSEILETISFEAANL